MEQIVSYLKSILDTKGHFNYYNELKEENIKIRHSVLMNTLVYNRIYPFAEQLVKDAIDFTPFILKIMKKDNEYGQQVMKIYYLMKEYETIWSKFNSRQNGQSKKEYVKEIFGTINQTLSASNYQVKVSGYICYREDRGIKIPKSFNEIVALIDGIDEKKKVLFFRGHENYAYQLIPSIYRGTAAFYEREMFYDAINKMPQELDSSCSAFQILTKLQHFGTPTRLLDLTTNPLVALFFACKNNGTAGEVLCFAEEKDKIKLFDSDTVSVLSNLAKMPYEFNISDIDTSTNRRFNKAKIIRELVHKIKNEKPYFENIIDYKDLQKSFFVLSKADNPRIISQSGAFIICGMSDRKIFSPKSIIEKEKNVIKRIIIRKDIKKELRKSLDIFNISSGSLFPDLSELSQYIKRKYGCN